MRAFASRSGAVPAAEASFPVQRCTRGSDGQSTGEMREDRREEQALDLQPKLTVGAADDPYERVADDAVGAAAGERAPEVAPGVAPVAPVRRRAASAGGAGGAAPDSVSRTISRSGEPLDDSARALFGPRFGHDFGNVRIHRDAEAAASARDVAARAYTVGNHVVFGSGGYAPDSRAGRALLAHELAHVAQQAVGADRRTVRRRVASDYDTIEDNLSYGIIDWAITDAEAREVLEILDGLSELDLADTVAAMDRDGLFERLLNNIPDEDRERYAVLIARMMRRRSVSRTGDRVEDRLSYGVFDWAVTDQDARDVLQVLMGLEPQQLRTVVGRMVNADIFDRFMNNLPDEDRERFAAFIDRLHRVRQEFEALSAAHLEFLREQAEEEEEEEAEEEEDSTSESEPSSSGGAGRIVRQRVATTGYGGAPSTWGDLTPRQRREWRRRARQAIAAVEASVRGTELEDILDRSELVFRPREIEENNAYAYVSGTNRLFFGRGRVRDAEEDVRNVWQSIAHELGGHEEFGSTWSWQIMQATVAGMSEEERAEMEGSSNSLFSAYGYLETEIYAELREMPHRISTSGGDRPQRDIAKQLKRLHEAFGPEVSRQIVTRLYYRVLDDPRITAEASRLLRDAIQAEFDLFPLEEPVLP